MALIILDKDTENEKRIPVKSVTQDDIQGILNGSYACIIEDGGQFPVIPDIGDGTFTTWAVYSDDSIQIPFTGDYDKVVNYTKTYFDEDHRFNFHVTLGKAGEE